MLKKSFLSYLQFEKRYSKHTLSAYATDLDQYFDFCKENGLDDKSANLNHHIIRKWIVGLLEADISARTVNRKISSLKSFYRFLLRENKIMTNPMDKVLQPKYKKNLPYFVEEKHMDILLDELEFTDGFAGIRDRLIIEVLYCTGIRLNELINIRLRDYANSKSTILVTGKRNKQRLIPLSKNLNNQITEYLELRKKEYTGKADGFLFLTDKGVQLYPKFVYRLVNNYLNKVTTIDKKSPHILRHTFATIMLNHGADLNAIKEFLGHANLSATQIYTHSNFEKLKSIYKQAHPRA